jgi:predicted Zn-dependent protease with MMP-like domain
MKREDFVNVVEDSLDSLPEEFRRRIKNVAILVEDFPPKQSPPQPGQQRRLLIGIFHGVPKSASKSAKRLYTNWDTISA